MPFLGTKNGVTQSFATLQGIARAPSTIPISSSSFAAASPGWSNPWGLWQLNGLWSWLNNLYFFRLFPRSSLGDRQRLNPASTVLEYGNILDDILDPCAYLNTYAVPLNFGSPTVSGNVEGITFTQENNDPPVEPPNPPLPNPLAALVPFVFTLEPGEELRVDVAIDGSSNQHSTLFLIACYGITPNTAGAITARAPVSQLPPSSICSTLHGQRLPFLDFLADWESPPTLRQAYQADPFTSDYQEERRTSTYDDDDVTFFIKANYKTDGRVESTRLMNQLARMKHRAAAIPFYFEPLSASVDVAGSLYMMPVNFLLEHLIYEGSEIVRINLDTRQRETRRVVSVDRGLNVITVDQVWSASIAPSRCVFYFVLPVILEEASQRVWKSDTHQTISCSWRSL